MKLRWIFRILAFIIAVFLWFQYNLLKDHTVSLALPITIKNIPESMIILEQTHVDYSFVIEGRGINILMFKFSKPFIEIDASNFKNIDNLVIVDVNDVIGSDKDELKFTPRKKDSSIYITMDKIKRVKKKIQPYFDDSRTEEIFKNRNYELINNDVDVLGPETILETIEYIATENIVPSRLNENEFNLGLISPNSSTQILKQYVKVVQKKNPIITKVIPFIPIELPKDFTHQVIQKNVVVKIRGNQEIVDKISSDQIKASIVWNPDELRNFTEVIIEIPPQVEMLEYTPTKVQVMINENK